MGISGPTIDLPPGSNVEKKFAGRARLYIGNVTNDITDEDLSALFSAYGETAELFVNREKNFAFIRMVSLKDFFLVAYDNIMLPNYTIFCLLIAQS